VKKTIKENFRVEVFPKSLGDFGLVRISDYAVEPDEENRNQEYKAVCEDIVCQIERHVDGVGSIYVEFDTRHVCSFCGFDWDVNTDPDDPDFGFGEPCCCTAAQDEWKEQQRVAKSKGA